MNNFEREKSNLPSLSPLDIKTHGAFNPTNSLLRPSLQENLSLTNMASEPNKKRKIDEPLLPGTRVTSDVKNVTAATTIVNGRVVAAQTSGINSTVSQNKSLAVTQAQQDGCTGNYRIFDSPYGNFLLPVVPTRAELA